IGAVERASSRAPWSTPVSTPTNVAEVTPLPGHLEPLQIEAARRDIFVPVEPAPPPAPVIAAAPPPPPPPPPAAPAVTWRYLGSMVTPAGERLVMLSRSDTS